MERADETAGPPRAGGARDRWGEIDAVVGSRTGSTAGKPGGLDGSGGIVFVVDDDAQVRNGIGRLVRSVGLTVETFASAGEFLERGAPDEPACLVLDVRMPGRSGLDLQHDLARAGLAVPIVFLTGHGTVPISVRAMKAGAVDFLEKPVDEQALLDAIQQGLRRDREARDQLRALDAIRERIGTLTPREREVFRLVASGLPNKLVADRLGASEKTVKVHRGRVMQKMQADSLADLVRMAERCGELDAD